MRDFFEGLRHIHFIGVGGVSMSKLCAFTCKAGIKCTGSDSRDSDVVHQLRNMGVNIVTDDSGVSLARAADLTVYSSAIRHGHPELAVSKRAVERKCYLGAVSELFDKVIAVSGTHGKTTVTAMLVWVLRSAGVKVTAHIGGDIIGEDNLSLSYGYDCFVTEACEYSRSFLELRPDIGVILNVDYDHPDCYRDLTDTYMAFSMFAGQSQTVIYASECAGRVRGGIPKCKSTRTVTFGTDMTSDYVAENINIDNGVITFNVRYRGRSMGRFTLYSYNEINVRCGLAAIAIASSYGVDAESIRIALATFPGVKSRMECLGKVSSGARLINDYAHHPKEIATVISAGRRMPHRRLITVFEPHTFSRTKALLGDFIDVLSRSDVTVIMPTYKAREISLTGEDSITLYKLLSHRMDNVVYVDGYDSARQYLAENTSNGDIILAVGAGLDAKRLIEI